VAQIDVQKVTKSEESDIIDTPPPSGKVGETGVFLDLPDRTVEKGTELRIPGRTDINDGNVQKVKIRRPGT